VIHLSFTATKLIPYWRDPDSEVTRPTITVTVTVHSRSINDDDPALCISSHLVLFPSNMPTNHAPPTELEDHCFYHVSADDDAAVLHPTSNKLAGKYATVLNIQTVTVNAVPSRPQGHLWRSYGKTTINKNEQDDAEILEREQSSLRNIVIAVDALNALLGFVCLVCFIVSVVVFVLLRESYANHHHHHHLGNSTTAAEFSRYETIGDDLFQANDDTTAWANASFTCSIGRHSNRLEDAVSSIWLALACRLEQVA
jgi:hypothetical protein